MSRKLVIVLLAGFVVCVSGVRPVRATEGKTPEGMRAERLDDVDWKPGPFAKSRVAVLAGDPKAGMHHAYLELEDGACVAPHWHSADEYVTIVQGTILIGTGDVADRAQARLYGPGSFLFMPAGVRHYVWAKGKAVLSQTRGGAVDFNWVNPADAPALPPKPADAKH